MLKIEILEETFDPLPYVSKHQSITPHIGAQSIFVGYMRDFREDNAVDAMTITHYPQMTESYLTKQAALLVAKYQLLDMLIAHRVGRVEPTDALVLISSTSSHRANATQATQEMLEILKFKAPFWKKEHRDGVSRWVEDNTSNTPQKLRS